VSNLPVKDDVRALARHGRDAVLTATSLTAVVWATTLVDWLFAGALSQLAVRPWTLAGLIGIPVMPFVHAGVAHLVMNTIAAIPLMFLAAERRVRDVWVVAAVATLTGGLGAWLLGGVGTLHIGASGVIFGWLGFVLGRGLFERRLVPILLSVVASVVYSGSLLLLLPVAAGISWQAHLFGLLGGLAASAVLARRLREDQRG
jgi:membrane associated rhomboid family serine protease